MAEETGLPTDLAEGYRLAKGFLDPVLDGSDTEDRTWNLQTWLGETPPA